MRFNGTFRYSLPQGLEKDPETGFLRNTGNTEWREGCCCQIERSMPAKQVVGTDGQVYRYTYDLFAYASDFSGELCIGTRIQAALDNGTVVEFTVEGLDNINGKYIELWG